MCPARSYISTLDCMSYICYTTPAFLEWEMLGAVAANMSTPEKSAAQSEEEQRAIDFCKRYGELLALDPDDSQTPAKKY